MILYFGWFQLSNWPLYLSWYSSNSMNMASHLKCSPKYKESAQNAASLYKLLMWKTVWTSSTSRTKKVHWPPGWLRDKRRTLTLMSATMLPWHHDTNTLVDGNSIWHYLMLVSCLFKKIDVTQIVVRSAGVITFLQQSPKQQTLFPDPLLSKLETGRQSSLFLQITS